MRAHWVRPEIVVQVAFIEWTVHGKLRHPRLLGVRTDKARARGGAGDDVITHPEKVLFPDDGITKGELAAYYEAIAPLMLPHMRGRPVTMERYPARHRREGLHPEGRLEGLPGVAGARRRCRRRSGTVHHPLVDRRALAALAGQPELHHAARLDVARAGPVPARHLRLRSRSVATTTPDVLRAAALARARPADGARTAELGEDVRLEGLPHRRAARRRRRTSTRWRGSPTRVGAVLVKRDPEHLTQEFSKADRGGRIFVDTGRNGYSATFAAAYAVRAKPGAPVSAPCTWEEIESGEVGPQTFTLRTMADRIADVGDLWSELERQRRSLDEPLAALERLLTDDDWAESMAATTRRPTSRKRAAAPKTRKRAADR